MQSTSWHLLADTDVSIKKMQHDEAEPYLIEKAVGSRTEERQAGAGNGSIIRERYESSVRNKENLKVQASETQKTGTYWLS